MHTLLILGLLQLYCSRVHATGSPYLDHHGEMDLGLARGRPLHLDEGRMEQLRQMFARQNITSHVARIRNQTSYRGSLLKRNFF